MAELNFGAGFQFGKPAQTDKDSQDGKNAKNGVIAKIPAFSFASVGFNDGGQTPAKPKKAQIKEEEEDAKNLPLPEGLGFKSLFVAPRRTLNYCGAPLLSLHNAMEAVNAIGRPWPNMRADAILYGNFVYGDFVTAFFRQNKIYAEKVHIASLSLNATNINSLEGLMADGHIRNLTLHISYSWYADQRNDLVKTLYQKMIRFEGFQLCVFRNHMKVITIEADGGWRFVLHGSANLRASDALEQLCVEENPQLHDHYAAAFESTAEYYYCIDRNKIHPITQEPHIPSTPEEATTPNPLIWEKFKGVSEKNMKAFYERNAAAEPLPTRREAATLRMATLRKLKIARAKASE